MSSSLLLQSHHMLRPAFPARSADCYSVGHRSESCRGRQNITSDGGAQAARLMHRSAVLLLRRAASRRGREGNGLSSMSVVRVGRGVDEQYCAMRWCTGVQKGPSGSLSQWEHDRAMLAEGTEDGHEGSTRIAATLGVWEVSPHESSRVTTRRMVVGMGQ